MPPMKKKWRLRRFLKMFTPLCKRGVGGIAETLMNAALFRSGCHESTDNIPERDVIRFIIVNHLNALLAAQSPRPGLQ